LKKDRTVGHNFEGNPLETFLFLFDFIWIKHLTVKQNYTSWDSWVFFIWICRWCGNKFWNN